MTTHSRISILLVRVLSLPLLGALIACPKKGNEVASLPPAAATSDAAEAAATGVSIAATNDAAGASDAAATDATAAASPEAAQPAAMGTAATAVTAAAAQKQEGGAHAARIPGSVTVARQGTASFKVAGHIARTLVRVGDSVKRGQILASLDDADYRIRERMASAAQAQAQVQYTQAKRDNERELALQKENATTQSALERAANAVTNAELAFQQAQLSHDQAAKNLADTQLASPFDGVISRRLKVEGEFVGVGAAVFELAETGNIEISLRVPENQLKELKVGQDVTLSIPSANQTSSMRIIRIVPIIQESSRTFEVIGRPTGSGAALIPGQFVEARL